MPAQPLIDIDNVFFRYCRDRWALAGISMRIPEGARVAVVGPNGAGKSTLFLHMNAVLQPQAGRLLYRGRPYEYKGKAINDLRRKVGLVFQDPDTQLFSGTVLEDIMFGPLNLGLAANEAKRRAAEAAQAVEIAEVLDMPVHFLSYGQKKRAAIAGVLAMEPEILVMDEPTAGLDYPGLVSLNKVMDMLSRNGKTVIAATHDIDWAWSWADLVYVLGEGKVVAEGSPSQVLNREDHEAMGFARSTVGAVFDALAGRDLLKTDDVPPRTVAQLIERLRSNF